MVGVKNEGKAHGRYNGYPRKVSMTTSKDKKNSDFHR